MASAYENILYEVKGPVGYLTLNRPEKMNALSNNLRAEMIHALKNAEGDPQVSVIVVRGAGRTFSAGYDIGGGRDAPAGSPYVHPISRRPDVGSLHMGPVEWAHHVIDTNWVIWEIQKPVIAQIHGYCLAGGTELATMCDFRIVTEDAIIGYPPVRAMTTMDNMWAPWHLPMAKARELAYLGDPITGKEMAHWGWANRAVPGEQLQATVDEFAHRLSLIDQQMLIYSKRSVNRAYEVMGIRTALYAGADIQALSSIRPQGGVFNAISAERGLKAALQWRDGPFADYGTHGKKTERRPQDLPKTPPAPSGNY
ncbi:MAG: enoyl-CoA hydratase [Dehalococcoidia bacterium]|nr:enoyl-CoA hydratase [Dehalococcoidia bacterium]